MKHLKISLAIILCFFFIAGATCQQQVVTPEDAQKLAWKAYDKGLVWYTKTSKQYIIHYDAAPPDVQKDWSKRVAPVLLDIKVALDEWKKVLKIGQLGKDEEDTYEEYYSKIILMGLDWVEEI